MQYCARCLYPANAKPTIILDEEGVCSGCRYHESRKAADIDWDERRAIFEQILDEARTMAKQRGNHHALPPARGDGGGCDAHDRRVDRTPGVA